MKAFLLFLQLYSGTKATDYFEQGVQDILSRNVRTGLSHSVFEQGKPALHAEPQDRKLLRC
jgi:hypothetical protein